MQRLNQRSAMRIYRMPSDDWQTLLSQSLEEFPNFRQVLQTVVHPLLAMQSIGVLSRMPPILLVGPPGVGKSFFASRLATLLNVDRPIFLDFSSESNSGALSGSSVFWANSSPGKLFQQIAFGAPGEQPIANPVIVIDEVDKVAPGQKFDPLSGLYTLLEEETAMQFEDQAVPGLVLDLSQVRFILTANDVDLIPAPILSRLMVFEIDAPSRADSMEITRRMFSVQVEKMGIPFDRELPEDVLEDAVDVSPRKCKTRLGTAIGIAIANGRSEVDMCTWRLTDTSRSVQVAKMGFV
jgi:ATP-dependent Lon protease